MALFFYQFTPLYGHNPIGFPYRKNSANVIYLTKRTNHVNIIVVKELRRLSGGIYNVGFTENKVD